MKPTDLQLDTLLTSIITSASIIIAIGFPLIIYFVTSFESRRENLLQEIKANYPKFNLFRELIYTIYHSDLWENREIIKQYISCFNAGDKEKIRLLKSKYEFLSLFESLRYIGDNYAEELVRNMRPIFSFHEIEKYQKCANQIWYSLECRNGIVDEIRPTFYTELHISQKDKIRNIIGKISSGYNSREITFELIADISGEMEVETLEILHDLTWNYERPLDSISKQLFSIMSVSLIFGVIGPMLLLMFHPTFMYEFCLAILGIIILFFTSIILLTWEHIRKFYSKKYKINNQNWS